MYVKAILSEPRRHEECESMEGTDEKDAMCEFLKANYPYLIRQGKGDLEGNCRHYGRYYVFGYGDLII